MSPNVRRSGLLVPLFSAPSSSSWGIGDIGDIGPLARWLARAGQRVLQLLPINEMASGHHSPYSAMSAMAIDPIFIRVDEVADFVANGGEASLSAEDREGLEAARRAPHIEYGLVRRAKHHALCAAFDRFCEREWAQDTPRAAAFRAYTAAERWWLDDYALFRAIHEREHGRSWTEWPEALRRRDAAALDAARAELGRTVRFYQYLQWIAGTQWAAARESANASGVALFGDLPFMVDTHSADVWMHQDQFDRDRSVGVPPDAFSATGQDWGMPPYKWDTIAADGYTWLRNRARRSAALFDGYRVDHLVGFYRTYSRPRVGDSVGEGTFSPAEQAAQTMLGEQVLAIFRESGAEIIAEDLGTVPDFVRASLARLGLPGFKVFRWERDWDADDEPFHDPAGYPPVSVATTGTHDTEPMIVWWEAADEDERAAVAAIPSMRRLARDSDITTAAYDPMVRDLLIELLFASPSRVLLFPVQDVFGWRDRINEPATVSSTNWSYRLPWPVDRLDDHPTARERQAALRGWAEKYDRL
jgi:4-alpha-glucanotransferase